MNAKRKTKTNKQTSALFRREFLQVAGVTLGGAAALYLLRDDVTAVVNAVQRQLNPDNSADIVAEDEAGQHQVAPAEVTPQRPPPQPVATQTAGSPEAVATPEPPAEIQDPRANGYSLWDTINLDSAREKQKYPLSMIVVDNQDRVLVGSNAWPVGYSEQAFERFQNPASFRTLTYIPWSRPLYQYNPHTWVHSGTYGKHRFFGGKLEEAFRLTPKVKTRTTAEMLVAAQEDFRGASAYLCQASYADGFGIFQDVTASRLPRLLDKFVGNVLSMRLACALRLPDSLIGEYGEQAVVADPLPWMQVQAQKTISVTGEQEGEAGGPLRLGWGWEDALSSSRWYLAFCSASTADELVANDGDRRIDEGEWILGFDIVDRKQTFDAFV